jgi:hypothetical protein
MFFSHRSFRSFPQKFPFCDIDVVGGGRHGRGGRRAGPFLGFGVGVGDLGGQGGLAHVTLTNYDYFCSREGE